MNYREQIPSDPLLGLVKAYWNLDAKGSQESWVTHHATPDGCIELILRKSGRSRWGSDQPPRFAVGLSDSAVSFEISGDAKFVAIRLWPWTWRALTSTNPAALHGRWIEPGAAILDRIYASLEQDGAVEGQLESALGDRRAKLAGIGRAILASHSVAEVRRRTGMTPRQLQRWFANNVGLSPRRYLRLLRFQNAFAGLPEADALAGHAAEYGFADQAHMARDFRQLAGKPASIARRKASGPFLA
jgi:AraC-like DNA-binding protein